MAEMDIVPYIGTRTPEDFDTLFDELEAARGSSASLSDAIAEKADNATTLSGYGITDAYTKTETGTQITNAIAALDVSSVGGNGKYISAISETDGKISATAETMDTTPTSGSEKAVTSGAVYAALASKQDALSQSQLDAANSGITAAKLAADEAALVELDDRTVVQKAGATIVTGTTTLAATGVSIQLSGGSIYRVTAMAKYKGVNLDTIAVKYVISGVEYLVCISSGPSVSNQVYLTTSGVMTPSSSITAVAYVKTESQGNVEIMLLAEKIYTNHVSGTRSAPALAKSAEPEEEPETGEEEQR